MTELTSLHAKITGDASSLSAAAKRSAFELNKLRDSQRKAKREAEQHNATMTAFERQLAKVEKRLGSSTRRTADYHRALRALVAQQEIDNTQKETAERQLQDLADAYGFGTQRLRGMNREIRASRFHSANMFAQFQDIGVMMAAGQSPFLLGIQQGSQMSQVFMSMGGTVKGSVAAMRAAFSSLISPLNLLTIGGVAAVAALGQWAITSIQGKDRTDRLSDSFESFVEKAEEAAFSLQALNRGFEDLTQFSAVRQIEILEEKISDLQTEISNFGVSSAIGQDALGRAALQLINTRKIRKTEEEILEIEEQIATILDEQAIKSEQKRIASEQQAVLEDEVKAIQEQQAAVLAQQEAAKEEFLKRTQETTDAERLLGEQLQNVVRLQQTAAGEAERMRDAAMAAAREFMTVQGLRSRFAGEEAVMGQTVLRTGQGTPAPSSGGGSSRSSGGGGGRTDPFLRQFESLVESLKNQEQLQVESFEKQQQMLQEALERKLLTQLEYQGYMEEAQRQHSEKMADLNVYKYGSTLARTESFLGDMANSLRAGNDKLLQIGQTFGAAEALVNAWRAYNQVIADPSLPWYAKIPAATKVLAAGLGAVQSIKSLSGSSGGGGGGGSSSSGAGSSGQSQAAVINIVGNESSTFDRGQVIDLINEINEAVEDGATIRVAFS